MEGLGQGGIGDVPLVLVELARSEETTRWDEYLVHLVDHRRLADAGIAGHEHQLRRTICHDTVERSKQRVNFALPSVKPLRDQQAARYILSADRERLDPSERLPC